MCVLNWSETLQAQGKQNVPGGQGFLFLINCKRSVFTVSCYWLLSEYTFIGLILWNVVFPWFVFSKPGFDPRKLIISFMEKKTIHPHFKNHCTICTVFVTTWSHTFWNNKTNAALASLAEGMWKYKPYKPFLNQDIHFEPIRLNFRMVILLQSLHEAECKFPLHLQSG